MAGATDLRLSGAPSSTASQLHKNAKLKYNALLTRALDHAKLNEDGANVVLEVVAVRVSEDPLEKKRTRWQQIHDPHPGGTPGLISVHRGVRIRVTERLGTEMQIWKHTASLTPAA